MYREKVTKNIITKESIKKDLYGTGERNIRSDVIGIVVCLLWIVFVVLAEVIVYNVIVEPFAMGMAVMAIFIIIGVLTCVPAVMLLPTYFPSRKSRKETELYVIVDEVAYKDEIRTSGYSRYGRRRLEKIIHFRRCGDVVIDNNTWFQLTSNDDKYYVVVSDPNSNYPLAIYPQKMYEYRE